MSRVEGFFKTWWAWMWSRTWIAGEKSCANDVAVDSTSGNVYVTNCAGNFLWKVSRDGTPSVFVKHENFTSQPISPLLAESSEWSWAGFNGIVYEPRKSYLLVVQTNTGAMFRVGVEDQSVHVVIMKEKLPWADGMALREDGTLVVVSKEKVWLVGSASNWMAANVVDAVPLNASEYTTAAAMKKRSTFIVHTHLPDLYANRTREEFEVREIEFPAEVSENHPVWLIVLIVLIVVVVSLWRFQVGYLYQQYRRKRAWILAWISQSSFFSKPRLVRRVWFFFSFRLQFFLLLQHRTSEFCYLSDYLLMWCEYHSWVE